MSWTTIRNGAKTRLDTISGVSTHARVPLKASDSVIATVIPDDNLVRPSGHRGKVEVHFAVRITVFKSNLEDSQTALDGYVWPTGTDSIVAAMLGDSTLGGTVDDIQWVDVSNYEQLPDSAACRADINLRALVTA